MAMIGLPLQAPLPVSAAHVLLAQAQAEERLQAQLIAQRQRDDADTESDNEGQRKKRRKTAPIDDIINHDAEDNELGCRNQTGYIGVRQRKWGMYAAEIRDGDKRRWLGSFSTGAEAGMAYDAAAVAQKGNKAKTNFKYRTYETNGRAVAETVDYVRWDLLPEDILAHYQSQIPAGAMQAGLKGAGSSATTAVLDVIEGDTKAAKRSVMTKSLTVTKKSTRPVSARVQAAQQARVERESTEEAEPPVPMQGMHAQGRDRAVTPLDQGQRQVPADRSKGPQGGLSAPMTQQQQQHLPQGLALPPGMQLHDFPMPGIPGMPGLPAIPAMPRFQLGGPGPMDLLPGSHVMLPPHMLPPHGLTYGAFPDEYLDDVGNDMHAQQRLYGPGMPGLPPGAGPLALHPGMHPFDMHQVYGHPMDGHHMEEYEDEEEVEEGYYNPAYGMAYGMGMPYHDADGYEVPYSLPYGYRYPPAAQYQDPHPYDDAATHALYQLRGPSAGGLGSGPGPVIAHMPGGRTVPLYPHPVPYQPPLGDLPDGYHHAGPLVPHPHHYAIPLYSAPQPTGGPPGTGVGMALPPGSKAPAGYALPQPSSAVLAASQGRLFQAAQQSLGSGTPRTNVERMHGLSPPGSAGKGASGVSNRGAASSAGRGSAGGKGAEGSRGASTSGRGHTITEGPPANSCPSKSSSALQLGLPLNKSSGGADPLLLPLPSGAPGVEQYPMFVRPHRSGGSGGNGTTGGAASDGGALLVSTQGPGLQAATLLGSGRSNGGAGLGGMFTFGKGPSMGHVMLQQGGEGQDEDLAPQQQYIPHPSVPGQYILAPAAGSAAGAMRSLGLSSTPLQAKEGGAGGSAFQRLVSGGGEGAGARSGGSGGGSGPARLLVMAPMQAAAAPAKGAAASGSGVAGSARKASPKQPGSVPNTNGKGIVSTPTHASPQDQTYYEKFHELTEAINKIASSGNSGQTTNLDEVMTTLSYFTQRTNAAVPAGGTEQGGAVGATSSGGGGPSPCKQATVSPQAAAVAEQ